MRNLARAVTALSALPLLSAVLASAEPLTYDFISRDAPRPSLSFALPAAQTLLTPNSLVIASSPFILNGDLAMENIDISTLTTGKEEASSSPTITQFITSVPEPSSLALLGTGMLNIGLCLTLNRKLSSTRN